MNCPKCGHEHMYNEVCAVLSGEDDNYCFCTMSKQQIELACWRAEALAARGFISRIDAWCEGLSFTELYSELQVYTAARVNDEKETP